MFRHLFPEDATFALKLFICTAVSGVAVTTLFREFITLACCYPLEFSRYMCVCVCLRVSARRRLCRASKVLVLMVCRKSFRIEVLMSVGGQGKR